MPLNPKDQRKPKRTRSNAVSLRMDNEGYNLLLILAEYAGTSQAKVVEELLRDEYARAKSKHPEKIKKAELEAKKKLGKKA